MYNDFLLQSTVRKKIVRVMTNDSDRRLSCQHDRDFGEIEKSCSILKQTAALRVEKYTHVDGYLVCQEKPEIWILCETS